MGNFNNELANYNSIPRDLVFDSTMSDRARFVYVYMSCKPDTWDFYLEPMAKEIGYSVETLRKYINELVASGWLVKGEQKNEKGVFGATEYTLKANNVDRHIILPTRKNTDTVNFRHGKNPTQDNIDYIENRDNIEKRDIIEKENIIKKEKSKKESSKEKSEDEVFVDKIYKEYPTKCPLNNRSTNKSYKDKERIRRLMKIYSKEDIRKVVNAEKEKVGKFYLRNFSTFLNNFPDPNSISDDNTSLQTKENKEESSYSLGADYPTSVDDVRKCDIHSYPNPWYEWMYERCPKISNGARNRYSDWDKIDQNWTKFVNMCGDEKTLSYACLVLERDGYEKYIKNNSFMWMVRNFLEQNNLYNGNGK